MSRKDKVREGVKVFYKDNFIGVVNRVVKNPEWGKVEFFTLNGEAKEVLLPIEAIYEAKDGALYLNFTKEEVERLPEVDGKEICNEAGYIFPDLREAVYETLNLARPFLDYF
jgi:hypothetical protein